MSKVERLHHEATGHKPCWAGGSFVQGVHEGQVPDHKRNRENF